MRTIKNPPQKDIMAVVMDKDIYDRHTQDTDPNIEQSQQPDLSKGWVIYGGYVGGEIASLFMVNNGQLHFYCLKAFRENARELLRDALKMHGKPVFCQIPTLYKAVINFAKKAGFKHVETLKRAWLKGGVLYDVEKLKWADYSAAAGHR